MIPIPRDMYYGVLGMNVDVCKCMTCYTFFLLHGVLLVSVIVIW
jgi:hypothetical protein